jgi:hypothetical protein
LYSEKCLAPSLFQALIVATLYSCSCSNSQICISGTKRQPSFGTEYVHKLQTPGSVLEFRPRECMEYLYDDVSDWYANGGNLQFVTSEVSSKCLMKEFVWITECDELGSRCKADCTEPFLFHHHHMSIV